MISFLKIIRVKQLLIIAFMQYVIRWCLVFPLLKAQSSYYQLQLSEFHFFLLVLSTILIAAAGYIINDYFDVKIDKINKPEKILIDNGVKRRVSIVSHIIFNFLALFIVLYLSFSVGLTKLAFIQFICVSGLWFYSTTFKKQFLIGNLIIALFTALVPFLVVMYEILPCYKAYLPLDENFSFSAIWLYLTGISLFLFLITLINEIVKDMESYDGDIYFGYNTMPIVIGIKLSKLVLILIAIIIIIFLSYYQILQLKNNDWITFFYFLVLLQLPLLFFIYKIIKAETKEAFQKTIVIIQIIMLSGICYLFLFAYILLRFIHLL